jgi:hypothetical protein
MTAALTPEPCRYCRGFLQISVAPVVAGVVRVQDAATMWCRCAREAQRVFEAVQRYVDQHGFAPTLRELAGLTHHAVQTTVLTVAKLERAGLVARGGREVAGKGHSRGLRLVQPEGQR